jgi:uncharacterized membrane protein YqjE
MAEIHIQPEPGVRRPVADAGPASPEPSIGDLFRQLAQDSTTLIRQEVALAKVEMRENMKSAARDVTGIVVGGVIAFIGALVLTAFLVILLGMLLANFWLAALIVGLLYVIIGGGLAYTNLNSLRQSDLKPEQTIETLREDKEWVQQEIREVKRELT